MPFDEPSDDGYSDSGITEELPKYWSAEKDRVCKGVEREHKAVSLVTLCGTYLVVCADGEVDEVFAKNSDWKGTFTLGSLSQASSTSSKHLHMRRRRSLIAGK